MAAELWEVLGRRTFVAEECLFQAIRVGQALLPLPHLVLRHEPRVENEVKRFTFPFQLVAELRDEGYARGVAAWQDPADVLARLHEPGECLHEPADINPVGHGLALPQAWDALPLLQQPMLPLPRGCVLLTASVHI